MTGEGHCPRELWCNQPAAQKDDFAYSPEPIVGVCQKWWRLWFPGGQALERRSKLVRAKAVVWSRYSSNFTTKYAKEEMRKKRRFKMQ